MFSVIDPKGQQPNIKAKSHTFSIAEQREILAKEFEATVRPALTLVTDDQLTHHSSVS